MDGGSAGGTPAASASIPAEQNRDLSATQGLKIAHPQDGLVGAIAKVHVLKLYVVPLRPRRRQRHRTCAVGRGSGWGGVAGGLHAGTQLERARPSCTVAASPVRPAQHAPGASTTRLCSLSRANIAPISTRLCLVSRYTVPRKLSGIDSCAGRCGAWAAEHGDAGGRVVPGWGAQHPEALLLSPK